MRSLLLLMTATLPLLAACRLEERPPAGSAKLVSAPDRFSVGTAATPQDVASVDFDVDPAGRGLPGGNGDATSGAAIYAVKCASCHGKKGEGIPPNPMLVGREPREGFRFANDPKLVKTIGNYWPYATTLFDYIRRAMPIPAPGGLTNDEVYSLTAYLLVQNEVIPASTVLDSASLAGVRMPARDRFVRDDRRGGPEVR